MSNDCQIANFKSASLIIHVKMENEKKKKYKHCLFSIFLRIQLGMSKINIKVVSKDILYMYSLVISIQNYSNGGLRKVWLLVPKIVKNNRKTAEIEKLLHALSLFDHLTLY